MPFGIKSSSDRLARICGAWKLLWRIEGLLRRRDPMLTVFTYHRVVDHDEGVVGYLDYDAGIGHRAFARQLDAIVRRFDVVDLETFEAMALGERAVTRRSALITFDDADSEFPRFALPELVRRGLPAVVFTPSGHVETSERFWHLRVTNAVSRLDATGLAELSGDPRVPESVRAVLRDGSVDRHDGRRSLGRALCRRLDPLPLAEIDEAVDRLERVAGGAYDLGIGCMTWEELRSLPSRRVSVQSHTVTHRKLDKLGDEEIARELRDSRRHLQDRIGNRVCAICYPGGAHDGRTLRAALEEGYALGFTTKPGLVDYPVEGERAVSIPRLTLDPTERGDIDAWFGKLATKRLLGRPII